MSGPKQLRPDRQRLRDALRELRDQTKNSRKLSQQDLINLANPRLAELDVICIVLGCGVDELLIPEPEAVAEPRHHDDDQTAAVGQDRQVTPRAGGGRSLPPR